MRGDSAAEVEARVAEMLELVALTGFEQRDIHQLSGGEQQRVALARALAPGPRLLMLDEPLGALDRALRERLMLDLRQILKQVGVTAVYVTHDQTEAFAVADRIAVMKQGDIEQIAPPSQLYHQPANPFVARFLGFRNLLPATVTGPHLVKTAIGELQLAGPLPLAATEVTLLIRPEAATLHTEQTRAVNVVEGEVTAVSFRGRYYQVWVNVNGTELMFELADPEEYQPGDTVTLHLAAEEIICL